MILVLILIILIGASHIPFVVDATTDSNQRQLHITQSEHESTTQGSKPEMQQNRIHKKKEIDNNIRRRQRRREQDEQWKDSSKRIVIQPRIIGGTPVYDAHEFPFYAIPAGQYLCGATMIWEDIAISAAHCASYFTDEGILVGGTTIDGRSSTTRHFPNVQDYIHPEYIRDPEHPNNNSNDIVVLHIVGGNVAPPYVQLNSDPTSPSEGSELTVIGFGDTVENVQSASTQLLLTTFNTIPYSECLAYYGSPGIVNDTTMICAGTKEGGHDSCQGDSGGPVMTHNIDTDEYFQVGIVSFGDGCGKANAPSVNTRVSNYIDWIQTTVCSLSNNPPSYCLEQQHLQEGQQKDGAVINNDSNNSNKIKPHATIIQDMITLSPIDRPTSHPTTRKEVPAVSLLVPTSNYVVASPVRNPKPQQQTELPSSSYYPTGSFSPSPTIRPERTHKVRPLMTPAPWTEYPTSHPENNENNEKPHWQPKRPQQQEQQQQQQQQQNQQQHQQQKQEDNPPKQDKSPMTPAPSAVLPVVMMAINPAPPTPPNTSKKQPPRIMSSIGTDHPSSSPSMLSTDRSNAQTNYEKVTSSSSSLLPSSHKIYYQLPSGLLILALLVF